MTVSGIIKKVKRWATNVRTFLQSNGSRRYNRKTFIKNLRAEQSKSISTENIAPKHEKSDETFDDSIDDSIGDLFENVLNIDDRDGWERHIKALRDVGIIERECVGLNWCNNALAKLKRDVDKYAASPPSEFDSTEIARKTKKILERLIPPLDTCYRSKDKYQHLIDAIEKYFGTLYVIRTKNPSTGEDFKGGDDYDDWLDLYLNEDSAIAEKTSDAKLHGKLKRVMYPPYSLNFIDEDGEPATLYFGGQCVVYSYRQE